jgi:hypothetical protein
LALNRSPAKKARERIKLVFRGRPPRIFFKDGEYIIGHAWEAVCTIISDVILPDS